MRSSKYMLPWQLIIIRSRLRNLPFSWYMEEEPPYWNNIQIHIQEEREPLIESTTADMPSPKKVKSQWFIWDPCGIACVVFTYIFLAYGVLVLLAVVGPAFPDVYTLLATCAFSFLVFLSVVSHVKAMITNPVSGH